jgi:hypothetical protein
VGVLLALEPDARRRQRIGVGVAAAILVLGLTNGIRFVLPHMLLATNTAYALALETAAETGPADLIIVPVESTAPLYLRYFGQREGVLLTGGYEAAAPWLAEYAGHRKGQIYLLIPDDAGLPPDWPIGAEETMISLKAGGALWPMTRDVLSAQR